MLTNHLLTQGLYANLLLISLVNVPGGVGGYSHTLGIYGCVTLMGVFVKMFAPLGYKMALFLQNVPNFPHYADVFSANFALMMGAFLPLAAHL